MAETYLEGAPDLGNKGTGFTGIAIDSHSNVTADGNVGPNVPQTDFGPLRPEPFLWGRQPMVQKSSS